MNNKLPDGCLVIEKDEKGYTIGHINAAFCPFRVSTWKRAVEKARVQMGLDEETHGANTRIENLWDFS